METAAAIAAIPLAFPIQILATLVNEYSRESANARKELHEFLLTIYSKTEQFHRILIAHSSSFSFEDSTYKSLIHEIYSKTRMVADILENNRTAYKKYDELSKTVAGLSRMDELNNAWDNLIQHCRGVLGGNWSDDSLRFKPYYDLKNLISLGGVFRKFGLTGQMELLNQEYGLSFRQVFRQVFRQKQASSLSGHHRDDQPYGGHHAVHDHGLYCYYNLKLNQQSKSFKMRFDGFGIGSDYLYEFEENDFKNFDRESWISNNSYLFFDDNNFTWFNETGKEPKTINELVEALENRRGALVYYEKLSSLLMSIKDFNRLFKDDKATRDYLKSIRMKLCEIQQEEKGNEEKSIAFRNRMEKAEADTKLQMLEKMVDNQFEQPEPSGILVITGVNVICMHNRVYYCLNFCFQTAIDFQIELDSYRTQKGDECKDFRDHLATGARKINNFSVYFADANNQDQDESDLSFIFGQELTKRQDDPRDEMEIE